VRVKVLYFDCFSGAAGDMIVGALIDAGVPLADVRRALGSLAIAPHAVSTEAVTRAGLRATKFNVAGERPPQDQAHDDDHEQGHTHEHDHHQNRDQQHEGAHRLETDWRDRQTRRRPRAG
jgi:uncharacterized protein (DUF111 family)